MSFGILAALFVLGLLVGGQVNRGIYGLAWDRKPYSPWSAPHPDAPGRRWFDRIPVIGWVTLARETPIHGSNFWLRPLLIELCFGFGFAGWASWEINGGLLPSARFLPSLNQQVVTLIPHLVLISLMAVATFIDLDEKTIPDEITIPGTLFALIWYTIFPAAALPLLQVSSGGGIHIHYLTMSSPLEWPAWLDSGRGAAACAGIFAGWCIALLPMVCTARYGLGAGLRFWWASVVRPRRRGRPNEPRTSRSMNGADMHRMNRRLLALAVVGVTAIIVCWSQLDPRHWRSLVSSMIGLGFGGALVWGIRLVGSWAMKQEAMGFGDVTLLAMIGAFLGWQSALLILFLAPFAALVIGVAQLIIERETHIAFGPYLCLAAVVLLAKWAYFWQEHGDRAFRLGSLIPLMVIAGLIAMGGMLFVWGRIKATLLGDED